MKRTLTAVLVTVLVLTVVLILGWAFLMATGPRM